MPSFEEMGLREELLRTLEGEDLTNPTGLQEAVIPALRRGGNLVARASSGSGKTLAYGIGVLDRIKTADGEAETNLRVLILTPTAGEAERIASTLVPYAHSLGLNVAVPSSAWGTPAVEANVLVAAAGDAMTSVRGSQIKLESVESVVIDGASSIVELNGWEQVDALLDLIPRDAQRVVFSAKLPAVVEDVIERRVKRALRYPAEPAIAERGASAPLEGTIGFVVASEREKFELLARQLGGKEGGSAPPLLFCRNDDRAADLAERLSIRGFMVGDPDEEDADVAIVAGDVTRQAVLDDAEGEFEPGQSISYDVPPDAATLLTRHRGDPDAVVLVEPRELAHLREIAQQARFYARSAPMPAEVPGAGAELDTFREHVRTAIRQEDLSAQMLVLEPLFEEYTAAEISAGLAALLRRKKPPAVEGAPIPVAAPPRSTADRSASTGPPPATWARLFVSIGSRDDIKAGDIVGALAGEANIPGSRIGKIEIRDSFSIVEVQADVADQVIRAVNGTTVKGRSVRVDFDRGGPERRPPTRGGSPPRRASGRPPRDR